MKRKCLFCKNKFSPRKRDLKKGWGKFCCLSCHGKWRIGCKNPNWKGGEVKILCSTCGEVKKVKQSKAKCGKNMFCTKSCASLWNVKHSKSINTSIELKLEKYLQMLGIKYESQKLIPEGRTVADFYIPEQRLVLYADGLYWHNKPGAKEKDKKQNSMLRLNGFKILRLKENEIKNDQNKCLQKIQKFLVN